MLTRLLNGGERGAPWLTGKLTRGSESTIPQCSLDVGAAFQKDGAGWSFTLSTSREIAIFGGCDKDQMHMRPTRKFLDQWRWVILMGKSVQGIWWKYQRKLRFLKDPMTGTKPITALGSRGS